MKKLFKTIIKELWNEVKVDVLNYIVEKVVELLTLKAEQDEYIQEREES